MPDDILSNSTAPRKIENGRTDGEYQIQLKIKITNTFIIHFSSGALVC